MATSTTLLFALFLSIISSSSSLFSHNNSLSGFRTSIIHRDSPQSPLYNPNSTVSDRIKAAKMRSLARHRHRHRRYFSSPDDLTAPVMYGRGEYLIQLSIGTPPIETYAIVDTGSDIIWLQCFPCEFCYPQMGPFYVSTQSSSYESIKCNTPECNAAIGACYGGDKCRYEVIYQDDAYTRGYISYETLIFRDTKNGENFPLFKIIFGCGVNNKDTPGAHAPGPPGLIGLNLGQLSFIRQISFDHFAYCFIPDDNKEATSPMTFGLSAIFEGARAPMKYFPGHDEYYLNLVGISVGDTSIQIPPGAFDDVKEDGQGGFLIDSGSTYTIIHSVVYKNILTEVSKQAFYDSVPDTTHAFDLCYDVKMSDIEFGTPEIKLHFFGGSDLVLKGINAWVDNGYGLVCLAMLSADKEYEYSILGNHQQQDIYVGYNLKERYLTFKPMDCTEL